MSSLKALALMTALMLPDMPVLPGEQKPHEYKKKRRSKAEKRKRKLASKNRRRNNQ